MDVKVTGKLTIDASSWITATGCGYTGGYQADNNAPTGRTLGNVPGSTAHAAGSYGGLAGKEAADTINGVYGSLYYPQDPGSGGGGTATGDSYSGGSGGGVIRIQAEEIENNGLIRSNGGWSTRGGAGSGGSIWIDSGVLNGQGQINADGVCASTGVAGGGGRIAIYYTDASQFDLAKITAYGGLFPGNVDPGKNGAAGTIYLKMSDQVFGDLIVHNNNTLTPADSTPLPGAAAGTVLPAYDTLNANELTDSDALFIPGALTGMKLNPAPQGAQVFTITGNTSTTIFTDPQDGNMTDYGSGLYIGQHHLFNLTVKGGAHVFTYDRIIVNGVPTVEPGSSLKAENMNQQ
jgi:hypothetical protein